ncbi:hypothetical protein [Bacillus sp. NP247]|nr:hypothetical protein [Bacillus sp. NP247]
MNQVQELVSALTPIWLIAGGVTFLSYCIFEGIPKLIDSIKY